MVGDVALANIVKLLIIDEVHLLHSDRGPVVEAIVARTLRQVCQNIFSTLCYCYYVIVKKLLPLDVRVNQSQSIALKILFC